MAIKRDLLQANRHAPARRRSLPTAILIGSLASLSACGSSDPSVYALAPVAGQPLAGGPTLVETREPTIASGLDRDRIVLNDAGYKLHVSTSDAWSGSLASQISHVLSADLAQRLPGTSVFAQDDVVATTPRAYVELVITHFAASGSGEARLVGQVAVHAADSPEPIISRPLVLTTSTGSGTASLVAALSVLLGQAADQIATQLRGMPA